MTPEYIICLEDGQKFKSLKRHLTTHYDMSPEEYREKWGLPRGAAHVRGQRIAQASDALSRARRFALALPEQRDP